LQRDSDVACIIDLNLMRSRDVKVMDEDRGRARDDYEEGNDVSKAGAGNHVDPGCPVLLLANTLLYHRGLNVELHPWRDRRADDRDDHQHVGF